MTVSEIIFWIAAGVLFYCYLGYGLTLLFLNSIKKIIGRPGEKINISEPNDDLPQVTLIVAAYNEDYILEQKIQNTLSLHYPADKLKVVFVTDGSTDGTLQLLKKYPEFLLLHLSHRRGKTAAINRAMRYVQTPLVIFSDANAMLNRDALQLLVSHFNDPRIGGVAGEKKIFNPRNSAMGTAEGLYWRYESFLKKQEATFHSVTGAAGELFAIRTALFSNPENRIILDDLMISVQVCLQGYRFAYEPRAYAIEGPSSSLHDEQLRKVRIAAGALQVMPYLLDCMNIFRRPRLSFQFISKKFLRWFVCPPALLLFFGSNILLLSPSFANFYNYLFLLQAIFYGMALAGWMMILQKRHPAWCTVPFYFTFMNGCLCAGFARALQNKQTVLWKKSFREVVE